ncbi:MAG: type II toxin-antitoxin system VapC family toxin [Methanotrichaceae archaeon]
MDVFIPRVCIIEVAAVVSRYADRKLAIKVSRRAMMAYEVVDEVTIFEDAWDIASSTGCSGFDSYFISLARLKRAILLTDDTGMHNNAKKVGIESLLLREIDPEDAKNLFNLNSHLG